ncbi:MAG: CGNR zinc finger domain-containing protein [Pseudomonadota bacterium]
MSFREHPVHLIGGRTCLDFLNTANWNGDGTVAVERLAGLEDVKIWTKAAGLACRPVESRWELEVSVWTFRASLRAIILAAIQGDVPKPADVARLNQAATQAGQQFPLHISQGAVAVASHLPLTYGVSVSAMALLTDNREISRVKLCPGTGCGWLFVDESANGRRQWCSMELCGNREKARRHYAKKRANEG